MNLNQELNGKVTSLIEEKEKLEVDLKGLNQNLNEKLTTHESDMKALQEAKDSIDKENVSLKKVIETMVSRKSKSFIFFRKL